MTWGEAAWGESPWGGLAVVPEPPSGLHPNLLPGVHLTIDGHPIRDIEDDWQADADAEGGYKRLSARVPLSSIRRFSLGQESQAVLYDDSGEVLWWGKLSQDPQVEEGIASLEAEGPAADAEKEAGRLLYQVRGYDLWQTAGDPPHNYGSQNGKIDLNVEPARIFSKVSGGDALSLNDQKDVVLWAPGTPGGLQRVAFTRFAAGSTTEYRWRVMHAAGPSGARTQDALIAVTAGTSGTALGGGQNLVSVGIQVQSGHTPATPNRHWLTNVRVNGIWGDTGRAASFDIMYADEGAADVFTRLGWGVDNTEINTNVLPQDHAGTYADLVSYFCELTDFCWLAPLVPGGDASFRPWGGTAPGEPDKDKIHTVSDGGVFNLTKLRLYNKVVVPYESDSKAPLEATAVPAIDPLPGVTREYVYDGLSDPQPDGVLATSVAQTLANLLGVPRWAGTVDVVKTREGSPYLIRPGDLLREENAGPGESRTHRVWSVTLSRSGVSVGIEDRVSVEGLVELAALGKARRFKGRGRKKRRKKKRRR